MGDIERYDNAVETIKKAILNSQYRAAKATNAEQLTLYYAIGAYVSANTRSGHWGTKALRSISESLQRELPGLRGFSERNLKYMRTFYEEWSPFFEVSSNLSDLSAADTGDSAVIIRHLQMPNLDIHAQEDFLSIGFTQHRTILEHVKDYDERLFYISRAAQEHYSVATLKRSIRLDDYHHQGTLPNNFLDKISDSQRASGNRNLQG